MSARGLHRPRWTSWIAGLVLFGLLVAVTAHASSPPNCGFIRTPPADDVFLISNTTAPTTGFFPTATFWGAFAVRSFYTSSDYDFGMWENTVGCSFSPLSNSAYGSATTDLIVGDFNYNPTGGEYYGVIDCFAGQCQTPGVYGMGVWRGGGFMFVDFPPTTVSFSVVNGVVSPDMLVHIWDVYLNQGSTYFFRFSSDLGSATKMLLFRNKVAGQYWATRGDAEFEATGCMTYTAPASGYYGLAVVNDVYAQGSYTIGVNSTPQCVCALDSLLEDTPVHLAPGSVSDFTWFTQQYPLWSAVGVRPDAGSDWDLEVGDPGSPAGCIQTVRANSAAGVFSTDFAVSDFNHVAPGTLSVHAYHYSGPGGATLEQHSGSSGNNEVQVNGPQMILNWSGDDVLRCWDLLMLQGQTYSFKFYTSNPSIHMYLFRNPGDGAYVAGRGAAEFMTSSDMTYTAPAYGWYGLVVVKDDDQPGTFALRVGTCAVTPNTLLAGDVNGYGAASYRWSTFAPSGGSWTAVGLRSSVDWDLQVCDTLQAGTWPDCYVPLKAESNLGSTIDLVVGDFHRNPPGPYTTRAHQFTGGAVVPAYIEWTGPATVIAVNSPATTFAADVFDVLEVYEAHLLAGVTYQIDYLPAGTQRKLLIFGDATGATYWAPRSQALLTTLGDTPFTPGATGDYAFVVANDGSEPGMYALRIATGELAADGAVPSKTRLLGASPNPGREDVAIRYALATPAHVRLELLDLSGRRVWSEDQGERAAGTWNTALHRAQGTDAGRRPGLYFLRFVVDGRVAESRKLSLVE